ncbi:phytase [Flavobacterium silvaticum]|uniref:Phytase n=1 Tax=Flavobacterium silvaticum TaxID=1852020 RepID=A0A972FZS0_9FLAO|nr:phytase [Flavobacterium silvaticum]NMH27786.1 phytase [Flavobacterium silvaticum]
MKRFTRIGCLIGSAVFIASCGSGLAPLRADGIKPTVVTQKTPHDTDDPAIWINPSDASKSLVIGTDKDTDGALYVFDLSGKIVGKSETLQRPNNVDIAYGFVLNGKKVDIAVTTERETNEIRVFSLPDLKPIDNGGIPVFEGEPERGPMGIALYTKNDGTIYAIVGRKSGPSGSYLWQYELDGKSGSATANVVRKFGKYSGLKEIEAIAVDNEKNVVYYCDETVGIRKYSADPTSGNEELAFFGQTGFKSDHEGIAIYKTNASDGYILVSNQQANSFMVFDRNGGPNGDYPLITEVPTSTIECDGADATSVNLGGQFPKGMFVAMSNGMIFHFYDWRVIEKQINVSRK